ncbi:MFS transporter [Tabrizicola sp.]|jgi:EmrB/QacA subfamily drug resistance transporter|uniref:MFS transporter n=1 Tax=Tabrizicola sp. TaxID=2005166 RepID=UPI0035AD9183
MTTEVAVAKTAGTRTIALVVAAALFMENIDSTILSTALPTIASDLDVNPLALKLALTSYLISLAIFIPPSGWIADRFGARRVFASAVLVFMAGSVACTTVSTLEGFVVARFLQGMGGAMMVPVGRLIVARNTPKQGFVAAMTWLTMPALLGPVLGPLVGGIIVTNYPWHWIFLINIPISLLCLGLALALLPREAPRPVGRFDGWGFLLSGFALSALMLGSMEMTEMTGPSASMLGLLAFGAMMMAVLVWHCRRVPQPILDFSLLRIATFRSSVLGGTLFRTGIGAIPFLLPLMLQLGFGLSAIQSGALTFVSALGALFMKPVNALILRRFGFRRVLLVNGALAIASLAAIGLFRADTPHLLIYAVLFLGGCLRSIQFTSLNSIAFADLAQDEMSRATSLSSAAQQVSLGLGVTLGATAVAASMAWRGGDTLTAADFPPAFLIVALVSGLSLLVFRRLPAEAGAQMAGRRA